LATQEIAHGRVKGIGGGVSLRGCGGAAEAAGHMQQGEAEGQEHEPSHERPRPPLPRRGFCAGDAFRVPQCQSRLRALATKELQGFKGS
jgi:hypothetical protein